MLCVEATMKDRPSPFGVAEAMLSTIFGLENAYAIGATATVAGKASKNRDMNAVARLWTERL